MLRYIVVSIVCLFTTAMAQFRPLGSTKHDSAMPAKNPGGDSVISLREMLVDVTYPDGRAGRLAFFLHFDPSSGRYQWRSAPVPLSQQSARLGSRGSGTSLTYCAAEKIVNVSFIYPDLVVQESSGKADNLDDAEKKAVSEATTRLPALRLLKQDDLIITSIRRLLPTEFFFRTHRSQIAGPFKLLDISHKGNAWDLTLEGSWQERITLNERYQITGLTRIK